VAKVRGYLNASKRYPTGREASMQRPRGKTRVWFVLARNGALQDAGVELSSGSMLLDNAALATVRRGSLPPFPDEAWSGAATRRFTVDLDFVPAE
jgi:protein TonB